MTNTLNTVHLFKIGYGQTGRCTGNDSFYAKTYKQARAIANSRCSRYESVIYCEKVTPSYAV